MKKQFVLLSLFVACSAYASDAVNPQSMPIVRRNSESILFGKTWYQHTKEVPTTEEKAPYPPAVQAYYQIGCKYLTGRGVAQDFEKAAKFFRQAAERGHAAAQLSLGSMYANGEGLPKNNKEACFWMGLAATIEPCATICYEAVARRLSPAEREEVRFRCGKWIKEAKVLEKKWQ